METNREKKHRKTETDCNNGDEKVKPQALKTSRDFCFSVGSDWSLGLTKKNVLYFWGKYPTFEGTGLDEWADMLDKGIFSMNITSGTKNYLKFCTPINIYNFFEEKVKDITIGLDHCFIITDTCNVYTYGANGSGQLGLGDFVSRKDLKLLYPPDKQKWAQISAGSSHSIAITQSGELYFWGEIEFHTRKVKFYKVFPSVYFSEEFQPTVRSINFYGYYQSPIQIDTPKEYPRWKFVTSGPHHSFAINEDGVPFSCGVNEYGAINGGCGYQIDRVEDIQNFDEKLEKITTSSTHSFGFAENGKVYAWGRSNEGQLGTGEIGLDILPPRELEPPKDEKWEVINAGHEHSTAITNKKNIYVWGRDDSGTLGLVTNEYNIRFKPQLLQQQRGDKWQTIITRERHSIAITQNANTYTWGAGENGEQGLQRFINQSSPKLLEPPKGEEWNVHVHYGWDIIRLLFISYYKDSDSPFFYEKMPMDILKHIIKSFL